MVRERSVSYLDENRAAYEEFLGGREKFDEYLANMRRDKVRFFPVLCFIPGGSTELFGFVSDSSSSQDLGRRDDPVRRLQRLRVRDQR